MGSTWHIGIFIKENKLSCGCVVSTSVYAVPVINSLVIECECSIPLILDLAIWHGPGPFQCIAHHYELIICKHLRICLLKCSDSKFLQLNCPTLLICLPKFLPLFYMSFIFHSLDVIIQLYLLFNSKMFDVLICLIFPVSDNLTPSARLKDLIPETSIYKPYWNCHFFLDILNNTLLDFFLLQLCTCFSSSSLSQPFWFYCH